MELIYGRNAVAEALRSTKAGTKVLRLYLADGAEAKTGGTLDFALKETTARKIPLQKLSRPELDKRTTNANHQGIVAEVSDYRYANLDEVLSQAADNPDALFLILDYLQDPQNLGTLIRCAEATGVTALIIPERRAAGITPAVRNASSGAVEHLHICQVVNLPRALDELKESGVWVAGLEHEPDAQDYDRADYTGKIGLVVGSEGAGLSRLVREKCDFFIKLPMLGRVESLNAAVAGSVALYEILRQRRALK
ncbi:23S rRNA (guanosine(2251)-2'-O)-methyltransferase RlmB [Candidatus Chlorohelix sp.]|uniref:23S rRNA (guanosine(2251)-2'-O)-methyltransferase RlmB n=1 Tax=Candidatus Chlorohelix sp. TaxID=3139201 RepID=UPI00305EBC77